MEFPRLPERFRNLGLFVLLSSYFILYPLLATTHVAGPAVQVLLSLAVLMSIFAQFSTRRSTRLTLLVVGSLAVVTNWLPADAGIPDFLPPLAYACFFLFTVSLFCFKLFTARDVDADTLFAAGCAYILLGFLFGSLFLMVYKLDPNSIRLGESGHQPIFELTYFSFVTLTTLGYGDIVPVSYTAQMLAAYEAIAGQIFMTVAIAELVGVHVAQKRTAFSSDADAGLER